MADYAGTSMPIVASAALGGGRSSHARVQRAIDLPHGRTGGVRVAGAVITRQRQAPQRLRVSDLEDETGIANSSYDGLYTDSAAPRQRPLRSVEACADTEGVTSSSEVLPAAWWRADHESHDFEASTIVEAHLPARHRWPKPCLMGGNWRQL